MDKRTIGIDLDTVLNNLNDVWVDMYNKDYDDNITNDNFLTWDMTKYVKQECGNKIYDYLHYPNLFRNLGVQPNAQKVTKWLSERFELFVVTAYSHQICFDKAEWIKEHFPHIDIKNIMFVNDKSKVMLDYLIDDRDLNIETFKGTGLIFDQPYNRKMDSKYYRVYDWNDVGRYFGMEIE